jgi:hypothetical protein
MTHVGERRTVSLDRPNVWLTHLNLAVAQRVCIALPAFGVFSADLLDSRF